MSTPRKLLYVSPRPCPAALRDELGRRHWQLVQARGLKAARPLLQSHDFLVALVCIDELKRDTAGLLDACREACDACEWVGVFPPGALQSPALRQIVLRHFHDHHTAPADPVFLCQAMGHAWGRAMLRQPLSAPDDDLGLVGRSTAMAHLRRLVRKAAASPRAVLVTGESGSGKEAVARALHRLAGRARFVRVDCADPSLDHRVVFSSAAGSTLFLDHVAELTRDGQAKLLRLLADDGALDRAHVVAACTQDLAALAESGQFRYDLSLRLGACPLAVPALRQRRDDIPLLAAHFLAAAARGRADAPRGFTREAEAALQSHGWPGNVAELRSRVQRAVLLAERRAIGPGDLGLQPALAAAKVDRLESIRVQAEREAITLSLDRFSQNVSLAARELGVSRMTLYRLMAKHSITPRTVSG
jgi:two-component system response regulator HydG